MFKKMNKMKIKKKLMTGFLMVAIMASLSGAISVVLMYVIDAQYSVALEGYGFAQGDIGKLLVVIGNADGDVHDVVSFLDEGMIQEARAGYDENIAKATTYLEDVKKGNVTTEEEQYFNKIESLWEQYKTKAEEIMEVGQTTDIDLIEENENILADELEPIYQDVYNATAELMNSKVTTGTEKSTFLTNMVMVIMVAVVLVIILVMVVCIFMGNRIAVGLSNPIGACVERLVKIAQGDLTSPVPAVDTEDETKELADAMSNTVTALKKIILDIQYLLGEMSVGKFNIESQAVEYYKGDMAPILASQQLIISSLSGTLEEIGISSNQVAAAAQQLAGGANVLAEGATDQASSIEELVATVNEVTDAVASNAENAVNATSSAKEVGEQAEISTGQMRNMTTAMDRISETSKQIEAIINTIEAIAAQTNLLSLNAAIEAARAGEAGKGFAVVAEEIRELANQSSTAANNTRSLIEASIQEVEKGNEITQETADSLKSVVDGIGVIMKVVEGTKSASEYQAGAMEQINEGITQISNVVQNNSATAEENSATSEELAASAETLNTLISRFELK